MIGEQQLLPVYPLGYTTNCKPSPFINENRCVFDVVLISFCSKSTFLCCFQCLECQFVFFHSNQSDLFTKKQKSEISCDVKIPNNGLEICRNSIDATGPLFDGKDNVSLCSQLYFSK